MNTETTQLRTDPEAVDFGVGQPQLSLLPRELVARAAAEALAVDDNGPLNYGHPKGDGLLRQSLAAFLRPRYRVEVDPAHFVTTNGASQALHMIAHIFAQPGDTVLVEEPTYFLAHQILSDRGLRLVGVPVGDMEALRGAVRQHRPAFFYTIPVFQNPTGRTLSDAERTELLRMAKEEDFLIVADEVYQLLGYSEEPPPPLRGRPVLSIGSFSKILAPGLRLGWIETAPEHQKRILNYGLLKSGGGLNPLVCRLVHQFIANGSQERYLEKLKSVYGRRIEVMDRALKERLGERVTYRKPGGGYFFWVRLPQGVQAQDLERRTRELKVGFRSGERFSSCGNFADHLRLSFAHYGEEAIIEGVARLARCL